MKKSNKDQCIYLLNSNGLYKIGISNRPEKRLKQFKTGNPSIQLICYSQKVFFAQWLEKHLHKLFSKDNVNGEWFQLNEESVLTLKKLLSSLSNQDYYILLEKFGE